MNGFGPASSASVRAGIPGVAGRFWAYQQNLLIFWKRAVFFARKRENIGCFFSRLLGVFLCFLSALFGVFLRFLGMFLCFLGVFLFFTRQRQFFFFGVAFLKAYRTKTGNPRSGVSVGGLWHPKGRRPAPSQKTSKKRSKNAPDLTPTQTNHHQRGFWRRGAMPVRARVLVCWCVGQPGPW